MSGIGNIGKFRHLAKLGQAGSLIAKIKLGAGIVELTSGVTNTLLKLSGFEETEIGKGLQEYLFWLEILSLSGELTVAIKNGLQASARKILEVGEDGIRKGNKLEQALETLDDLDEAGKQRLIDEIFEVAGMASKKQLRLWKTNIKEGKFNCANCAMAVDRTLGGNPASALPWTYIKKIINGKVVNKISYEDGTFLTILEKEYGKKFIKNMSPDKIRQMIKPGQRGIVYGYIKGRDMGHVFNVVNENGVIKFLDGQKAVKSITDTQKADLIYDIYEFLPTNF